MEIFKTLFNGGICEHLEEQIHLVPGNLFPGISLAVIAMIPLLTVGALDHMLCPLYCWQMVNTLV